MPETNEKSTLVNRLVSEIKNLDIEKFWELSSSIEEGLKNKSFEIKIIPIQIMFRYTISFKDEIIIKLGITEEELSSMSHVYSVILGSIVKEEVEKDKNSIKNNYPENLDKYELILSHFDKKLDMINKYKEKYLLSLYSKTLSYENLEWDVQTKYYHSMYDLEKPFSLAMIRLVFNTPLSLEKDEDSLQKEFSFELCLSDVEELLFNIEQIKNKLLLIKNKN